MDLSNSIRCCPEEVASRAKRAYKDLCIRFDESPRVLITVTGATDGFYMKHKDLLKKQILKAVESTDAWIMADVSLTSFIFSIFNECRRGFDKSTIKWSGDTGKSGNRNFRTNQLNADAVDKTEAKIPHCIIFDNTGVMLQAIEHYVANKRCPDSKPDVIPVVRVVIGGDETRHIEQVTAALDKNIPVVIARGSGGAADCIATYVSYGKRPEIIEEFMKGRTKRLFRENSRTINNCQVDKSKVYIHSFEDKDTSFEETIQNAIFDTLKEKNTSIERQIGAVQEWNRIDIFEQDILSEKAPKELKKDLSDLFYSSFVKDSCDFVKILVDFISSSIVEEYSDPIKMQRLYEKCIDSRSKCNAGKLIRSCINRTPIQGNNKYSLKKKNIGFESKIYPNDPNIRRRSSTLQTFGVPGEAAKDNNLDLGEIQNLINDFSGIDSLQFFKAKDNNVDQEEDTMFQFFVCCILVNRKEMATIFWRKCKNNVCAALFASNMLKKLSIKAFDHHLLELHESCRENADYFEVLACCVITEMFEIESKHASKLLVTTTQRYSISPLEFAYKYQLMKFMASTPCQVTLSEIWMGEMKPQTSTWKIGFGVLIPLLIIPSIDFIEMKKEQKDNQDYVSNEESCGRLCTAWKIIFHFYSAPITSFFLSTVCYIVFLLIFSFFVLTDLHPISEQTPPSITEYATWVIVISLFIDEIIQVIQVYTLGLKLIDGVIAYLTEVWNWFDIAAIVSFILAVILRIRLNDEQFFYARVIYSISLAMFILRTLQFFYISRRIGPKVIMLEKLFFDVIFFFSIFAIVVLTFGVVYQVILYPNTSLSWDLFANIIYMPYWQVYGELFIDHIRGVEPSECTDNPVLYRNNTLPRCPKSSAFNTAMLALYLLLTNVILLNTLVAMFSFTIQMVQEKSEMFWKHYRYTLIREYYERRIMTIPVLIHIWRLIRLCITRCKENYDDTYLASAFTLRSTHEYDTSERRAVESYLDEPKKARSRYALKDLIVEENTEQASAQDTKHQGVHLDELKNELTRRQDMLQRDLLKSIQEIKGAVEADKDIFNNLKNEIENRDKIIVEKIIKELKSQESVVLVHPVGETQEWKKTRIRTNQNTDDLS